MANWKLFVSTETAWHWFRVQVEDDGSVLIGKSKVFFNSLRTLDLVPSNNMIGLAYNKKFSEFSFSKSIINISDRYIVMSPITKYRKFTGFLRVKTATFAFANTQARVNVTEKSAPLLNTKAKQVTINNSRVN